MPASPTPDLKDPKVQKRYIGTSLDTFLEVAAKARVSVRLDYDKPVTAKRAGRTDQNVIRAVVRDGVITEIYS